MRLGFFFWKPTRVFDFLDSTFNLTDSRYLQYLFSGSAKNPIYSGDGSIETMAQQLLPGH